MGKDQGGQERVVRVAGEMGEGQKQSGMVLEQGGGIPCGQGDP